MITDQLPNSTLRVAGLLPLILHRREEYTMAGKGLKSLNEGMRALSLSAQSCKAAPVRDP